MYTHNMNQYLLERKKDAEVKKKFETHTEREKETEASYNIIT